MSTKVIELKDMDGNVSTYKVWLVAKGYTQR